MLQLWASKAAQDGQDDIYSKGVPRSATFQLGSGIDVESDEETREPKFTATKEDSTKSPQAEGGDHSLLTFTVKHRHL